MGNICCSKEDVDIIDRIEQLGNRVLDLEKKVFLPLGIDTRDINSKKKYKEYNPEIIYKNNPILCPPKSSGSDINAPLYVKPEAAHAMSWSR